MTAASIDLAAWLIVSLLVERTPIELSIEMLDANIGGGAMFMGILNIFFLDDQMKSVWLSMALGVAFIIALRSTSAACVAALFWSYSTSSEYFLLTLPALCCFRIMRSLDGARQAKWFAVGLFLYSALTWLQAFDICCDLRWIECANSKVLCFFIRTLLCLAFIDAAFRLKKFFARSGDRYD